MSKKKSLGSSPIGYTSQNSTMDFIPDLGVSSSKSKVRDSSLTAISKEEEKDQEQESKKKKIVSYSLEAELVTKIKSIADKNNMYYSSLVNQALKSWIGQRY